MMIDWARRALFLYLHGDRLKGWLSDRISGNHLDRRVHATAVDAILMQLSMTAPVFSSCPEELAEEAVLAYVGVFGRADLGLSLLAAAYDHDCLVADPGSAARWFRELREEAQCGELILDDVHFDEVPLVLLATQIDQRDEDRLYILVRRSMMHQEDYPTLHG